MKKLFLSTFILLISSLILNAQCDKKVVLNSSRTEYVDSSGNVERTVDENTVIEITQSEITIAPADRKMTGTVKYEKCNWTKPFKEGKSVLKTVITDQGGDVQNVTITIEGKDGRVYLTAVVDNTPNRIIRVQAEKFEEKK